LHIGRSSKGQISADNIGGQKKRSVSNLDSPELYQFTSKNRRRLSHTKVDKPSLCWDLLEQPVRLSQIFLKTKKKKMSRITQEKLQENESLMFDILLII